MRDFGFLNSIALLIIPLAVLTLFPLLRAFERSILGLHHSFGQRAAKTGRLRVVLPCLMLLLAVLAISRPYIGRHSVSIQGSGRDIFLLIDVSLSMLAQDAAPSRMDAAKRKAHDILSYLQLHAPEDRVGIILFAGDAYVYCPLTPDYGVIKEFLQHIGPDLISSRGSSLLRALTVSREALAESHAANPRLIIISDGEDLESERAEVSQLLSQLKGESLFLGLGSSEGASIPLPEGGVLTSRGQRVITQLNEVELKQLFNSPSHQYVRASLLDADFAPFLKSDLPSMSLANLPLTGDRRDITTYGEIGPFLLAACLTLILMAALSGRAGALFALSLLLLVRPVSAQVDSEVLNDSPAYQGNREYQRGDYQNAYESFLKAQEDLATDPRVLQSLGSAAFKLGKFAEAEKVFQSFEQQARTPLQHFDAPYNLGNSLLAQKKYKPAIEAFNRALARIPAEPRAIQNRAIAEALLKQEEQKQQSSSQSSEQSQSTSSSSESKSEDQQSSQGKSESQESSSSQQNSAENSSSESGQSSSQQSQSQDNSQSSALSDAQQDQGSQSSTKESSSSAGAGQSDNPASSAPSAPQEERRQADAVPLSEKEAHDWLKALPESPLLMQRLNKQERKPSGGQLW